MIGEHPLKIGEPLQINLTPRSTPSIINNIAPFFVRKIADHPKGIAINGVKVPMSYKIRSFDGGSDHVVFIDSYFGIPSLMMGHDDPNWHSNVDTVEYCDSTELKRAIAIALSISYIHSMFDNKLIKEFWPLVHRGLFKRLGDAIKLVEELFLAISHPLESSTKDTREELFLLGYEILKACYQYESESLEWIKRIDTSTEIIELILSAKEEMKGLCDYQINKWNERFDFDEEDLQISRSKYGATYKPNFQGPFYTRDLFKLIKYPIFKEFIMELQYEFLGPLNELINLLGKGYDIMQISAFLSLEYEKLVTPDKILKLVNHLENEELIKKK